MYCGVEYRDWLSQTLHTKSNSNADLIAHFFRRAFDLLRDAMALLGFIATNTIGQGDTRSTVACAGSARMAAQSTMPLHEGSSGPAQAAVVVSVVHITKGNSYRLEEMLDGREVETISAFLFHEGGHDDPARLAVNAREEFHRKLRSSEAWGFTFDDTDTKGMLRRHSLKCTDLIDEEPVQPKRSFYSYIGGEEVNTSVQPMHYHRYVVNFRNFPLRRQD